MLSKIESPQDTNKSTNLKVNKIKIDKPIVMGILNVTPDSFFDGRNDLTEANIIRKVNVIYMD